SGIPSASKKCFPTCSAGTSSSGGSPTMRRSRPVASPHWSRRRSMGTSPVLAESTTATRLAPIIAVRESLVTIDVRGVDVMRNEVGHILLGDERLKCEVLRVREGSADLQVFEDTRGVRVGDQVEMSGEMLSVALGPG